MSGRRRCCRPGSSGPRVDARRLGPRGTSSERARKLGEVQSRGATAHGGGPQPWYRGPYTDSGGTLGNCPPGRLVDESDIYLMSLRADSLDNPLRLVGGDNEAQRQLPARTLRLQKVGTDSAWVR